MSTATLRQGQFFAHNSYPSISCLKKECSEQASLLEAVRADKESLLSKNDQLNTRVIQLEQQSRACNVEIHCVPEHKNENIMNTVQQLSKVIKHPIDDEKILFCAKIAKMNKTSPRPRSILVKFNSPRLRDEFLAATSRFNRNNADKLNSSHLGIASSKKEPIYVSEHLAPDTKMLLAAARRKSKEVNYKFVWVRDGKIYMRKSENSKYIQIRNHDTINNLS
ncbi:unnamed protein product [Euphydryas editha]|uniref:FP protein C-terminal domain-containing protein n=1 Tax=Euphydryas editha TaxID=104508 RepID=A0AAU9V7B9_EUPED|nr:unnamed protein product [Euphydryas editha]